MPVKKHGIATLVLPNRPLNASYRPWGKNWWYCSECCTAYDRRFSKGCFCKSSIDVDTGEVTGSYVATPLIMMPDQDAAEAAFRLGGVLAVYHLVQAMKETSGRRPS